VQEARRNPKALKHLLATLGPPWRVITSDVTEGLAGNGERLAFLYGSERAHPVHRQLHPIGHRVHPGLRACPVGQEPGGTAARDHGLAEWMRDWAARPDDFNENLMVLGDFNLDRIGDPLYEAFIATGLWPPTELNQVPRTIFDDDKTRHFYDQIAWFSEPNGTSLLRARGMPSARALSTSSHMYSRD
jgi:hypothetical protein